MRMPVVWTGSKRTLMMGFPPFWIFFSLNTSSSTTATSTQPFDAIGVLADNHMVHRHRAVPLRGEPLTDPGSRVPIPTGAEVAIERPVSDESGAVLITVPVTRGRV